MKGNKIICVSFLALLFAFPDVSVGEVDWQNEYNQLKAKIEKEYNQPRRNGAVSKVVQDYVDWLGIKARDRQKATEFAGKAQLASNPYWHNRFLDLATAAQDSGDSTVWTGGSVLMDVETKASGRSGDNWEHAVFKAGPVVGQRLFRAAEVNGFDTEIIRDFARCLMRFANGDIEEGYIGLYYGRKSIFGYIDSEGYTVTPNRDYDITCERRDEFTTIEEGEPMQPADEAMKMVQQIRDNCDFYDLKGEHQDATDLMEQYLKEKEVLCDFPPDKGHYFFLKLAEDYELPDAKEHIEGFYATLYGKVEVETEEGRKPAPGAKVVIRSPKDKDAPKNKREWTTTADEDGEYEINRVILHRDCSPFEITAEYQGAEEETTYEGPLEEPDGSYEYEKNLLIRPLWEGTIKSSWEGMAEGDKSLITAIQPGGKYDAHQEWKIYVLFKKTRGNERIKVYELKSARIEYFRADLEHSLEMRKENRKIAMDGKHDASIRRRELNRDECNMELILDLKKKTYEVTGKLEVEDVPEKGEGHLEIKAKPIYHDQKDSLGGTTKIKEEINLKGKFTDDKPEKLEGNLNMMSELPAEFKKFMEDIGGKITWKIRWNLKKKGFNK